MADLVPTAVRDLLAFYTEKHPEARFGDLDIGVLQGAVKSVEASAQAVEAAEAALAQARDQFRGVEAEMVSKATRLLSFLRIHAEGDQGQLARLEAIGNQMSPARRKPKGAAAASSTAEPRQRRPRKGKDSGGADAAVQTDNS